MKKPDFAKRNTALGKHLAGVRIFRAQREKSNPVHKKIYQPPTDEVDGFLLEAMQSFTGLLSMFNFPSWDRPLTAAIFG